MTSDGDAPRSASRRPFLKVVVGIPNIVSKARHHRLVPLCGVEYFPISVCRPKFLAYHAEDRRTRLIEYEASRCSVDVGLRLVIRQAEDPAAKGCSSLRNLRQKCEGREFVSILRDPHEPIDAPGIVLVGDCS